jgi:uncharacterized protein (DUF58 family)
MIGDNRSRVRSTARWRGVNVISLVVSGTGVLADRPGLVLAGVIGIAFAAVARAGTPPTIDLSIERRLSDEMPGPDDPVTVTVQVTNTGNRVLPDLRIIDGVPSALVVEDGSPRFGTALRPGASAEFKYTVTAARGVHQFDPSLVIARDMSGAKERRVEGTATQTTITCVPPLSQPVSLPLREQTTGITGQVPTSDGGSGLAFHAVREYRHGDPLSRIDWNRTARTGEFSTIEFQRERSATVVLLIDAREAAYIAPDSHDSTALERSITAAGALFEGFLATDDRVGIAVLSPTDCWLAPGSGDTHRTRARELLATHPAVSPDAPDSSYFGRATLRRFRRRLPTDAQVVFCTPLPDRYSALVARRLDAHGHHVTVVSPDPMGPETAGGKLEHTERSLRCSALRDDGIRVIDWNDGSLRTEIETATQRWSA